MCAKRSGVVKRLKSRRAELLKLLNSGSKLNWNDSVKLHAELENIKTLISERQNQATATNTHTYPAIKSLAKTNVKLPPPQKKEIPKFTKKCPNDCEGPLCSPHCEYTCAASTGAPTKKTDEEVQPVQPAPATSCQPSETKNK